MGKRKGYAFEKETEALGGEYGKRLYKSGAVGTITGHAVLVGDVQWNFPWMRDIISIECKHGYGTSSKENQKYMTIHREWFDKHIAQTKAADLLPAWAMKFKFTAENGMSKFVVIPFSTMKEIIRQMENVYLELQELKNEQAKSKKGKSN